MKKFTNISKKKNKTFKEKKDKVLFDNEHVKIVEFEDWSILKDKDLAVCIPYFIEENKFLIRHEYIPTYKYVEGDDYYITILSGGIETGESPEKAIIREIEEEAGIVVKEGYELEVYDPLFISKGNTNKYHPFLLPLSSSDYDETFAKGDGSVAEKKSKSVKVDAKYIDNLKTSDLITDYMLMKLKEYLNLQK